jgi:hypothetical protein
MKNINAAQLVPILVVGMAIFLAVVVGNGVADENYTTVALSLGALAVIAMVALGSRFFILIPICWGLTGQISILPLPFSIRQLVIILASAIFIQGAIFKTNKGSKTNREAIDIWIWVSIGYIIIIFFMNPVGINALGGDRVGGKPYVDVALGLMSYLILKGQRISGRLAMKLPKYVLMVSIFAAVAGGIGFFLPQLGDELSYFYSAFSSSGTVGISSGAESNFSSGTRWIFLQPLGITLILYTVSACNPASLLDINNLKFGAAYLLGNVTILASGFRSGLIQVLLLTTISVMLRERIMGFFKIIISVFVLASGAVAISYLPIKLPTSFQRTLSFLPGNWEQEAILDASGSSEWRFEMWKLVLNSDRYIHDKIFGDGFGYLRADYERSIDLMQGKSQLATTEVQQEMFMLDGDFHSGPISTIRFVGFVGLALLLVSFYYMLKMAISVIKYSKGTDFQFVSYFYSFPIIALPFIFIFVFGDYREDFCAILFYLGMLEMIRNSIRESYTIIKVSNQAAEL